ncbi:S-layer homology domain-containing protein [Paenibacillus cellulosilyticus]|nr:S-layer homology domain-containing protein [Paenibacillus cellulosilyticus]
MAGALLAGIVPGVAYADQVSVQSQTSNASSGFTDLNGLSSNTQEAIQKAQSIGLLEGDSVGTFRPLDQLTRQEFAALLVRAMNLPLSNVPTASFSDVQDSSWSASYIDAVFRAGLMTGKGTDSFRPQDPVTREEMAAVFVRAVGGANTRGGLNRNVQDAQQVSGWAANQVEAAVRLGLIDTTDGNFNPKAKVQRGEIVSYLVDIFQSGEQTRTITSVDGDVLIIDGTPYLVIDEWKQLLGERNSQALVGAIVHFQTANRNINDLSNLEIVQDGVVLDLAGTNYVGGLRISGNGVQVNGDSIGNVSVSSGVSSVGINGNVQNLVVEGGQALQLGGDVQVNTLNIADPHARLTLGSNVTVQGIQLPVDVKLSQVIANLDQVSSQVDQVQTGIDDRNTSNGSGSTGISNVNHLPTVAGSISDVTAGEQDGVQTASLKGVFADADNNTLTYTAASSDTGVATVSVSGTTLSVTPVAAGTSTITVTANDGHGGTVSTTFVVTITAASPAPSLNHAPTVVGAIADITAGELDGDQTASLAGVFADADGDALTYTAASSVEGAATVLVSGVSVVITPIAAGTSTITVTADDGNGGTISTTFDVTITAAPPAPSLNHAPTVVGSIADITAGELDGDQTASLTGVFADADGDALTITAASSDEGAATVTVSGASVVITPVAAGTSTITVTADDGNGGTISTTFDVTITAAPPAPSLNHAPTVVSTIADITAGELDGDQTASLTSVFADADGDALTYTAASSDEDAATVLVSGTTLSVTPVAAGTSTITVTADDGNGGTVSTTFDVTITEAPPAPSSNHAPTVAGTISDVTAGELDGDQTASLAGVFADADGDSLTITAASSDEGAATVLVSGASVVITPVAAGVATITVTADDGNGGTISTTFDVTITAAPPTPSLNHAPTVAGSIADITAGELDGDQTASLAGVFADADGDDLTITAASSDEGAATVLVSGASVVITPVAAGTSAITVTADDGNGGTISTTFNVTITAAPPAPSLNHAPTVAGSIADITAGELDGDQTASLTGVFADADGDALTITAASSDEGAATVLVSGASVVITPIAAGTSTITVTADDSNGGTISTTFDVTITAAPPAPSLNYAPTVVSTIADITAGELDGDQTASLAGVFADADGDALAITAASSDEGAATVLVSGTTLSVTPVAAGTSTITVTADDGNGGTVSTTFDVTITAAPPAPSLNHAPTVVGTIANITAGELDGDQTASLTGMFADADGDALTITAASSDEGAATVLVSGTTLSVTPVAAGTSTITVTADDGNGGTVSTTFDVTITAAPPTPSLNHAPTVVGSIADITAGELDGDQTASLAGVFADADGDALTITAASSDEGAATVSVSGASVVITPVAAGTSTITVTADDGNGGTVSTTFDVTITALNHAPTVVGTISDVTAGELDGDQTASLAGVFADADGDALTITAASSDEGAATVSVSGASVVITPVAAGTSTITVTADDGNGGTTSTTFDVTITSLNHAPTVVGAIANITAGELDGDQTASLTGMFADADGDALTITAASSDEGAATVSVSGASVVITPVAAGTSTITVTADDGNGGTISTTFDVTITALNHAPTVVGTISDVTAGELDGDQTASLAGVFADADGDALTITAASSDEGAATVSVSGASVVITPVAAGTSTITVTADDGNGGTISTTFDVTITALNHAPTVVGTISNVTAGELDGDQAASLAGVFADADGDALTITAASSDEGAATVSVSGASVVITPVAAGTSTITVTADDGNGGTISTTFDVTITALNHAPTVANTIAPISVEPNGDVQTVSLAGVFADADNDGLTYTATTADITVVAVSMSGDTLSITPLEAGTATITVTAGDGNGGTVHTTIKVTVEHRTPFFSELVWSESDMFMQFIELYNPTGEEIDGSRIQIVGSNGMDFTPSGVISQGSTYTIAELFYGGDVPYDDFSEMQLFGTEDPVTLSLYYDGELVDVAVFTPATSIARTSGTTHGNPTGPDSNEWDDEGTDYTDGLNSYTP